MSGHVWTLKMLCNNYAMFIPVIVSALTATVLLLGPARQQNNPLAKISSRVAALWTCQEYQAWRAILSLPFWQPLWQENCSKCVMQFSKRHQSISLDLQWPSNALQRTLFFSRNLVWLILIGYAPEKQGALNWQRTCLGSDLLCKLLCWLPQTHRAATFGQ